jgi:hypothetical protein
MAKKRITRPEKRITNKKGSSQDDYDFGRAHVVDEYHELEQEGKLNRVARLRIECRKLLAELDNVWALILSRDQDWLDKFALRMLHEKKNAAENLQRQVDTLDSRRRKLAVKIRKTILQIAALGGSFDPQQRPHSSRIAKASTNTQDFGPGRNASGPAQWRDFIIRNNAKMSNEDLCKRLDFEFMQSGEQPAQGLPENWTNKYGVKSYAEAYKNPKTKPLIQKLISKAKQRV